MLAWGEAVPELVATMSLARQGQVGSGLRRSGQRGLPCLRRVLQSALATHLRCH